MQSRFLTICCLILTLVSPQIAYARADHHFAVTPIPKCGTHLLFKCLELLDPEIKIEHWGVGKSYRPALLALLHIQEKGAIPHTYFYHDYVEDVLVDLDYKRISLYRDPRDACVSLVFYLQTLKGNVRDFFWVCDAWDTLSFEERLHSVITGGDFSFSYLKGYYLRSMKWIYKSSQGLAIRFEDLIGSKGGGDDLMQRYAIVRIANHIGIELTPQRLLEICDNLFIPKPPELENGIEFTRGQIGNWRPFFSERHKRAFKKVFGKELIKLGYESNNNW